MISLDKLTRPPAPESPPGLGPLGCAVAGRPDAAPALDAAREIHHRLAARRPEAAELFLTLAAAVYRAGGLAALTRWGGAAADFLAAQPAAWRAAMHFLTQAGDPGSPFPLADWLLVLELAGRVAPRSPLAAEALVDQGCLGALWLGPQALERWVDLGLGPGFSVSERLAYFRGRSQRAEEALTSLAGGVRLASRAGVLALLGEAYLGRPVSIRLNSAASQARGFRGGAAGDGHAVYLPAAVPDASLFKLMTLHQVALWQVWDPERSAEDNHLAADRRLAQDLPALVRAMAPWGRGRLGPEYPQGDWEPGRGLPLWWGDYLPGLGVERERQKAELMRRAQAKGRANPEEAEALAELLLAQGGDLEDMWLMLAEMLRELEPPPAEEDPGEVATFVYPEWDHDRQELRPDWCLVRQRVPGAQPNDFVARVRAGRSGIIRRVKNQFLRLKRESFQRRRGQTSGDQLDLDAVVRAYVEVRAGVGADEGIYLRRDKKGRDVAVLLLVDLSGSTSEEVEGRRIIDVQKEAITVMGDALAALGDPFAILGFSSQGRLAVETLLVKDFTEPYGPPVWWRLGGLEPLGLTRLGAVVRHGAFWLSRVAAQVRLMIILTDGRPFDRQYGSLTYACHDTGRAIREAHRQGVESFIITSDQEGAHYLGIISPATRSVIVPRVDLLPTVLPAMYRRLTT
ncbi:MAG: hypothetical protein KQJ78_08520 [Deltaproteobacteria bacterium]|nr:hypothetical protein [Deltaproteobacteria bacterium]